MAGKTKVDLEFATSNGTTQTVSFEVPNGKDGKNGVDGAKGVGIKTITVTSSQVA